MYNEVEAFLVHVGAFQGSKSIVGNFIQFCLSQAKFWVCFFGRFISGHLLLSTLFFYLSITTYQIKVFIKIETI